MKRLSVIIPGYNTSGEWWKRCLHSVLAAIGQNDEVICIDDGSVVPVTAETIGTKDERVRIVRQENGGLSRARNAALAIAEGEFVTFIDSDDEVLSETFERTLEGLNRNGCDISIYGVKVIWVDEGLQKTDVVKSTVYGQLKPSDMKELSKRCLFNYAWNKVYRRDFLERHQLRFDADGMPCEDIIFNLRCVIAGATWCAVDYVGYVYYRTNMTLVSTYKPSNFLGLSKASDTWKEYKRVIPGAREEWGAHGELTKESLARAERSNRLKPGSPYWLAPIYNCIRRALYVRAIRRWRIKRMYPYVKEVGD